MEEKEQTKESPKLQPKIVKLPEKIVSEKPLLEQVREMKESMDKLTGLEKTKEIKKRFKFPSFVKRQTKNLKKLMEKNHVQVIILKNSGDLQPTIGEISLGRLVVGDSYWNAADNIIWRWMGATPTALVCEWDMQPITQKRLMDETNALKTWLHPQTIMIRSIKAMKADEAKKQFQFKPMMLIILGVVAIAAYWIFFGGT